MQCKNKWKEHPTPQYQIQEHGAAVIMDTCALLDFWSLFIYVEFRIPHQFHIVEFRIPYYGM